MNTLEKIVNGVEVTEQEITNLPVIGVQDLVAYNNKQLKKIQDFMESWLEVVRNTMNAATADNRLFEVEMRIESWLHIAKHTSRIKKHKKNLRSVLKQWAPGFYWERYSKMSIELIDGICYAILDGDAGSLSVEELKCYHDLLKQASWDIDESEHHKYWHRSDAYNILIRLLRNSGLVV